MKELIRKITSFRDARDWRKFHNTKDLSIAISIEAAELCEVFLWKKPDEANNEKVKEELADVFIYALLLSHEMGFDPEEIIRWKLDINERKYPVGLASGNAKKYDEL
jgi:NTP pyrophosphatase (non-canonical NTP hydrolase)